MNNIDLLRLSTRTFKTRLSRTLLTILGVSVGIGAIFFLVSLGYGLQNTLLQKITTSDALLTLDVSPSQSEVIVLNDQNISEIKKIENVQEVSPLILLSGQITIGDLTSNVSVYASHPSYFKLGGTIAQEGELFSDEQSFKAVISTALIKSFNLADKDALGKSVKLTLFVNDGSGEVQEVKILDLQKSYQVSGVVKNEADSFIYISLDSLKDFNIGNYAQAKVRVSDSKYLTIVREQIINKGFLVSALSDTVDQANKVFGVVQIILAIFGLISLVVAAIGLANTMTVTLLERTNEIGIMKAIGSTDQDIKKMFLIESVIMGFLGGAGGIVMGFLGSQIFNFGLNLLAKSMGGLSINLFYSPTWFVVFVIFFSSLVGFITGIFPSQKAAKMNPLEALRYK
jgi:putative ABC transport system permease protein